MNEYHVEVFQIADAFAAGCAYRVNVSRGPLKYAILVDVFNFFGRWHVYAPNATMKQRIAAEQAAKEFDKRRNEARDEQTRKLCGVCGGTGRMYAPDVKLCDVCNGSGLSRTYSTKSA